MEEKQNASQVVPQSLETNSKKSKKRYFIFSGIIFVTILLVAVIGMILKSQGMHYNLIPGNRQSFGQRVNDPIAQVLGCTSQQSCMELCSKPENQSKCQQLFQQYGQTDNQSGPNGQPNVDFAMAGNNGNTTTAALPDCQSNALFDHLPTDATAFVGVEPLGHMNGQHVLPDQADHVYINMLPGSPSGTSQLTNVYAPGDVTLLQVVKRLGYTNGSDKGLSDYLLEFSPCKSVIFAYDHIRNLNSKILSSLSSQPSSCQQGSLVTICTYQNLSIPLQSGEKIGTAGGSDIQAQSFDFAGADIRTKPLQFINTSPSVQTGVTGSSYKYAICPLDYFTPTLKNMLYSKLAIKNAGANGIPACGTTMQDKAGTLQGNWYHQGATQQFQGLYIQGTLAFVHSNLDPTKGEITAGTDLLPSTDFGAQMIFTPQDNGYINREPSQITPDGHVYCFDGLEGPGGHGNEGHVNMQLTDTSTMKINYGKGACSTNPVLMNPLTYVR